MTFIYIQSVTTTKKAKIPFRITLKDEENSNTVSSFNFRPEVSISKGSYEKNKLDRLELLSAPPFCDIADELIECFQNGQLVFSEMNQFKLLKAQFRIIGYNFNIKPKIVWHRVDKDTENSIELYLRKSQGLHRQSEAYATAFLQVMAHFFYGNEKSSPNLEIKTNSALPFNFSSYKLLPGVYYFLNEFGDVVYVGKAKSIRKRLQSHFSSASSASTIDYSEVKDISIDYTGNDLIAQLLESAQIKALKPIYNTQQVKNPAPYIINKNKTAKGIHKLQITRKDISDNLPETYFNRLSVKQALQSFAVDYQLCRKHCGIERVKGPCSNHTEKHLNCVCANTEAIADYNERFEEAFQAFKSRKSRKIYKLKGRQTDEDAFVYLVNDIYEGYGFIDKSDIITNENDLLGHLIPQKNNYDTSRILGNLSSLVKPDSIFILS